MDNLKIRVNQQDGKLQELTCQPGSNLLRVLQQNKYDLYAPCGGNGTCGKCSVRIHGEGIITSCNYKVQHDIDVFLPKPQQLNILTSQHDYCFELDALDDDEQALPDYGLAIDIGTTTLAFYFIELHRGNMLTSTSSSNPQGRYGADVISRIQFINSEEDKLKEVQQCLIDEINRQIELVCSQSSCEAHGISQLSIAGNPTMLHILLGIDPMPIAMAPFTPAFLDEQNCTPKELGINILPEGKIRTLPGISAYVGADIVAGIASIKPSKEFKNYLFLDIGTNGEMGLVTPDTIYTCATAAGPAFEGGNISCGMGAFPGAISEYKDPENYKTIEHMPPAGVCGSGLIDILAYMVRNQIVQPDGLLAEDYVLFYDKECNTNIRIVQQDIREVQLAKSAIMAGLNIMVASAGLTLDKIDALFLAGGFGNFINIDSAMAIGLVPKKMRGKVISIGNTSGTGAFLSLQSEAYNANMKNILERSAYIELSTHDDFVMEYAMNMNFDIEKL